MNRTTLAILLLAFALPTSVLAAASSEESARLCPKGKVAATTAPEVEAPAAPAAQGTPAAKPTSVRGGGAPTARPATQRWHSVLPGMVR